MNAQISEDEFALEQQMEMACQDAAQSELPAPIDWPFYRRIAEVFKRWYLGDLERQRYAAAETVRRLGGICSFPKLPQR